MVGKRQGVCLFTGKGDAKKDIRAALRKLHDTPGALKGLSLRVGMLGNFDNIVTNSFMPGAIIQPVTPFMSIDNGVVCANEVALEAQQWNLSQGQPMAPLRYCDAMQQYESQATLLKLSPRNGNYPVVAGLGETWVVLSGGPMQFSCGGEDMRVDAGGIFLAPPGEPFSLKALEDGKVCMFLQSEMRTRKIQTEDPATTNRAVVVSVSNLVQQWIPEQDIVLQSGVFDALDWTPIGDHLEVSPYRPAVANEDFPCQIVRARKDGLFSFFRDSGNRTHVVVVVLQGAMCFHGEVVFAGSILHLPADIYRYHFGLVEGSVLLIAAASQEVVK